MERHFVVCSDAGRASLESADGLQYLVHSITGEAAPLDRKDGEWMLNFDGDGAAYVSQGD